MELGSAEIGEYVNSLIEDHMATKDKEKSELGEVFTPVTMIETLCKEFPKSIWENPSHTWLDPASGIGNFPLVIFFWLMNGLRTKIPNKAKRAKHIIENMLYMVEINKTNAKVCKKLFHKVCPEATPNIHDGDFLQFKSSSVAAKWPSKYTCVVGNPPYNIGGIGLEGTKRTHIIFTKEGLEMLEPNGYIAYVCPPSYREAETPMNELFQEAGGHFVFIKIYGAQETAKLFHIQGRVDGFIYQRDKKGSSTVNDEYGIRTANIHLDLDRHIPNFGITIFDKMYKKVDKLGNVEAFRNTEMSSVKAHTFGCNGKYKVLHLIVEKGKRVFRTKQEHSLTKEPKLLINGLGVPYVYYDKKGEYGPSQSPVIVLRPSKNLVHLLSSAFFSFIAWGLRLTGNNNLPYLFDAIPNVSKEANPYETMADIKRGFQLTAEEVKFIESHFSAYEYKDTDIIEKCVRNATRKKQKK